MLQLTVKEAKTLAEKTKGLLGTSKPYPLSFQTRWGIHTFGMKYPIDIVILDKQNTVVALKKNVKPNRIFLWNPRYKQVVELPAGTIQEQKITRGLALTLEKVS